MTCIVAIEQGGNVWMGGDSAGVAGYALQQRADTKVFDNRGFLFGFTSSFRMGQLLRYRFDPPYPRDGDDLLRFMSTDFVDAARLALKHYGWLKVKDGVEEGGTFLVGFRGQIFRVEDDFQVGRSNYPFQACGCGEDIALGVLHALQSEASPPEMKLTRALEAAEAFSAGVRAPFHVIGGPAAARAEA
jgi:hypothetical protein